jgi:hypothetical protein
LSRGWDNPAASSQYPSEDDGPDLKGEKMPYTIDDFAGDWTLRFCDPPDNNYYPPNNSLTITKKSDGKADLFIQGNITFSGVPFESEYGRLNGKSTEGHTVTVTIFDPDGGKIVGLVRTDIAPVAGTWGADANGRREKKS